MAGKMSITKTTKVQGSLEIPASEFFEWLKQKYPQVPVENCSVSIDEANREYEPSGHIDPEDTLRVSWQTESVEES